LSRTSTTRAARVSTLFGAAIAIAGYLTVASVHAQTPAPAPAPAATPAAAPAAPATPPPAYGKLVVTGLIDGYYQYAFNKNKSSGANGAAASVGQIGNLMPTAEGAGAFYTANQNDPTLSLAEANLTILPAPGGFGAKATLGVGATAQDNVSSVGGSNGSENRYEDILQLYGSYAFEGSAGGELDFGKFYTPFGYEVTESNANYNYTRSTTYQLLPTYHTGFRLASPTFGHGFTLTGYLVQALYNTADEGVSNKSGSPAGIGQLSYSDPAGKFTFVETFGGGTNKADFYGTGDVSSTGVLSDTDFTYNITANYVVGLNYTYEDEKPSGIPSTTANGYGVYFRQQLNSKDAYALRYSGYEAKSGASTDYASADFKPYDLTATYEIKTSSQWLTRFEYRYDGANAPIYADSNSNYTQKDQSALIFSEVFTF
jgi:hypothetical protein